MKITQPILLLGVVLLAPTILHACIWDSDTLADEKKSHPTMAAAILGNPPDLGDSAQLRKRIADLKSNRRESDPAWWNDLAGAHIRLGESKLAAELLETVVTRFPDDYGIRANLGTAYHLLGRYTEAEKEIARDLEINPDAHFGLEKYHLALLQYLSGDLKYKQEHVYLDEYSDSFLRSQWSSSGLMHPYGPAYAGEFDATMVTNGFPGYRLKWNLAANTNRENGVLYMTSLNPREPACFVMLGIECLAQRGKDLNLAIKAFEKAIELGSPQAELLKERISQIQGHIRTARSQKTSIWIGIMTVCVIPIFAILILRSLVRWLGKRPSKKLD